MPVIAEAHRAPGEHGRSAALALENEIMQKALFLIFTFTTLLFVFGDCFGQSKAETVTVSDPAQVSLKSLFIEADLVAFVKIHSGDAESYKQVIYKAEVLQAFKGTIEKEIIYFTPFIGYSVGAEYLVFLKKTGARIGELIDEKGKPKAISYDITQTYYRIMYGGYSVMSIRYECIFDGKDPQSKCDYGVQFNTYQVKLPAQLKTLPKNVGEFSSDKRWVRRKAIEEILIAMKNNNK